MEGMQALDLANRKNRIMDEAAFNPMQALAERLGWPPQQFHMSHLKGEDDFIAGAGLRSYSKSRDMGFAAATGGLAQVHVNKRAKPFNAKDVSIPHFHDVLFHMVYVLKGTAKCEFEGYGVCEVREGSCWIQPPGIKHVILDYSDDYEILEVILPAQYDTFNIEKMPEAKG
ncbi:cupin domain-containing protein [Roseomonas sp. AR75]|uniref:cupin domain-containing protein n=1 Tax=Roseomonas sp. AR75 TaxID=2562311 RepID=UPI00197E6ECE|nr:cupin domain-containing protein [Roseomonas sp. AR75]